MMVYNMMLDIIMLILYNHNYKVYDMKLYITIYNLYKLIYYMFILYVIYYI